MHRWVHTFPTVCTVCALAQDGLGHPLALRGRGHPAPQRARVRLCICEYLYGDVAFDSRHDFGRGRCHTPFRSKLLSPHSKAAEVLLGRVSASRPTSGCEDCLLHSLMQQVAHLRKNVDEGMA